jgi:photosystem I subunit 2
VPLRSRSTLQRSGLRTLNAAKTETETKPYVFTPPTLDPNTPMPRFQGNTGGLLRSAAFQEFYVITFESPKEQIFEMPTGGAAEMRKGPNLVKFARKEQCLALLTQLRTKFKINGFVYRINQAKGGEVEYLHPKDGVYPEKIHPGAAESRIKPTLYNWETEPLAGAPLRCDVPRWAYGDEGQLAPTPLFFLWPFIYAYKFIFSEPPQYRYSDPEKLKIGPPEDWDMTEYWRN